MTQHITLEPWQLKAHKAGRLKAIVVPMKTQPKSPVIFRQDTFVPSRYYAETLTGINDYITIAPFTPGEPVAVKCKCKREGLNKYPPDEITIYLTLGQPTPIEIEKITVKQAAATGFYPRQNVDDLFADDWRTHHPDAKWGWYYPVEGATP